MWFVRVSASAAAMLCLAMVWVLMTWIVRYSPHCDYPEDCRERWFPHAYAWSGRIWVAVTVVGVVTLVGVFRGRASGRMRGLTAASVAGAVAAYIAAPHPGLFGDGNLASIGAPWSGMAYPLTALVYLASALGFVLVAARGVSAEPFVVQHAESGTSAF